MIAIRVAASTGRRDVCLVQKRRGQQGFPKGGRLAGESVLAAALREWREECGIPVERLRLLPGEHADEAAIGVRYLVALCLPPSGDAPGPEPPGEGEASWPPPSEDPEDPDPVVLASWVALGRALGGGARLSPPRVELLRQAVLALGAVLGAPA